MTTRAAGRTPAATALPVPSPRETPDAERVLVVAARPDETGLAAAQVYADRVGGEATHAGATGLDAAVREASTVVVLDPGAMRARMTRDRAFTATADPASRRHLLSQLAPYQDRVSWLSRPA
ncbi:hypothetical protein EV188_10350 [Actinomycetospora succinea]|uniref:Uncharacterized protein n=1 Tax=Actinomycetospora succinea TaxID=663603 RepID=A0A4R6VGX9_9PSEU|nr:hypothetical protein [Actinomycetospora succinea]TDQ60556.1 hypothetical protein EV188_10350 [Actinomycetospora succinea]